MSQSPSRPRVAAQFGLTLLETLRDQDLPSEILEDENVTLTMPRRLGLSDVVERQIRSYREAVRQRRRMTDEQVGDLIRLVVRRPDAREVFVAAGRKLAGGADGVEVPAAFRILPRSVAFRLTRRATAKGLARLFGRTIGGFAQGTFALEGRGLFFQEDDPSGQACHFLTGYCQAAIDRRIGPGYQVVHSQCQCHGDPVCRWTVTGEARARERDGVREMLLRPELETG